MSVSRVHSFKYHFTQNQRLAALSLGLSTRDPSRHSSNAVPASTARPPRKTHSHAVEITPRHPIPRSEPSTQRRPPVDDDEGSSKPLPCGVRDLSPPRVGPVRPRRRRRPLSPARESRRRRKISNRVVAHALFVLVCLLRSRDCAP